MKLSNSRGGGRRGRMVQFQAPKISVENAKVVTATVRNDRPETKVGFTEKEWAERHGRKWIEPPSSKIGKPVSSPTSVPNGRFMVEATPPTGSVSDPNNAGNILICHKTSTGTFVTLSIPPSSLSLYNNANNSDGACVPAGSTYCPPGSVPDCAGVCNGPSILDCHGNCYNPTNTPAAYLKDCAGVCYATSGNPTNVPDCNGVCGGHAVRDCAGVCDGTATHDCAGVCNGTHYVDCGGNCNTACHQVNAAPPQASKIVRPQAVKQTITTTSKTQSFVLKPRRR